MASKDQNQIKPQDRIKAGKAIIPGNDSLLPSRTCLNPKEPSLPTLKIIGLPCVESTNSYLKQKAADGADGWTVVVAQTQSEGRGRLARAWESPVGGLWFSLLLRPSLSAPLLSQAKTNLMSLAAGVAMAKALQDKFGIEARLKWPNDIMLNDKKVGGILAEAVLKQDMAEHVVIGIGLNTNFPVEELSPDLHRTASTIFTITGEKLDNKALLNEFLKKMHLLIEVVRSGREAELILAFKKFDTALGKKVRVKFGKTSELETAEAAIEGTAVDITEDGQLLVRDLHNKVHKVIAGDCKIIL